MNGQFEIELQDIQKGRLEDNQPALARRELALRFVYTLIYMGLKEGKNHKEIAAQLSQDYDMAERTYFSYLKRIRNRAWNLAGAPSQEIIDYLLQ